VIEKQIRAAAVCLADITTDNANVWFELGYALACTKSLVMVCENGARPKFPFDVQHRNIILYDTGTPSDYTTLGAKITEHIGTKVGKKIVKLPNSDCNRFIRSYFTSTGN
jgi:hypothetical protein